ncbi:MAG: hypothetical protein AAFP04_05345 [Myxococcota bacterium]
MKDPERYSLAKDIVVIALIFGIVAGVAVAIGYGALKVYRGTRDAVMDYAGEIFDAAQGDSEDDSEEAAEGPISWKDLEGAPAEGVAEEDVGEYDANRSSPAADTALQPTLTVHGERRIRRDGWLVSGLISNPSPLAIGGVTVRYELFDRRGRRLPLREEPIWVDGIPAGSSRPASFLLPAPPRATRYQVLELTSSPRDFPPPAQGLVATVTEQTDARGRFAATGIIVNTSPLPAFDAFVEVIGYATKSREKIVVVATATVGSVLLPGSKKRFSTTIQPTLESPAVIDVRAYGYQSRRR